MWFLKYTYIKDLRHYIHLQTLCEQNINCTADILEEWRGSLNYLFPSACGNIVGALLIILGILFSLSIGGVVFMLFFPCVHVYDKKKKLQSATFGQRYRCQDGVNGILSTSGPGKLCLDAPIQ